MKNDENMFSIFVSILLLIGLWYVLIWITERDRKAEEFYNKCLVLDNGDIHCPIKNDQNN